LAQALKAQAYIDSCANIPDFVEVWNQYFQSFPCALTVVPTRTFSTVGGLLEINMLALRNEARRTKQVIEAGLPAMTTYGPCIRVGEFVLPSALIAVGADGAVVGAGKSPGLESLAHAGTTQADCLFAYAEAVCAAAGTSMENLLRAQYFVSSPAEFAGVAAAWTSRYGRRPHPFAFAQTPTPLPAPGAVVIADFWIYAP
jgi:enamine deaminase RidA (YjgF/YER057c/UK114 family)